MRGYPIKVRDGHFGKQGLDISRTKNHNINSGKHTRLSAQYTSRESAKDPGEKSIHSGLKQQFGKSIHLGPMGNSVIPATEVQELVQHNSKAVPCHIPQLSGAWQVEMENSWGGAGVWRIQVR